MIVGSEDITLPSSNIVDSLSPQGYNGEHKSACQELAKGWGSVRRTG